ncbi:MAG: hypothetical protein ABJC39_02205 [Chloroflexota bacterium]
MLDHISQPPYGRPLETPASDPVDRSMDVLQYGTAFFAIVVAALLAVIH